MTDTTTPTRSDVLRALADRVERGESGREMDALVAAAAEWIADGVPQYQYVAPLTFHAVEPAGRYEARVNGDCVWSLQAPRFTTSLDATEAFRQAVLPGWRLLEASVVSGDRLGVTLAKGLPITGHARGEGDKLVLAYLSALLRARAAEMEGRT